MILSPFASARISSVFKISFPCRLGKKTSALVVDDSPTIRDLIASMFKELDYQVELRRMVSRIQGGSADQAGYHNIGLRYAYSTVGNFARKFVIAMITRTFPLS